MNYYVLLFALATSPATAVTYPLVRQLPSGDGGTVVICRYANGEMFPVATGFCAHSIERNGSDNVVRGAANSGGGEELVRLRSRVESLTVRVERLEAMLRERK